MNPEIQAELTRHQLDNTLWVDPGSPFQAELTVHADQPRGTINRNLYGQFAEHLGRCIYEGLWVGEDSPIPNTRGIRNDVVAALKNLQVPVLRWPGGCFADEYHWQDGVGPRDKRVPMVNTNWGGVKETNQFGTHEFFDLCGQVGCEPYVCGNMGSGTVQEMSAWVEYITSDADAPLANQRRANGREKPWKLKYFAVGNESWGCGGEMRPEFYADNFRRYNAFIKNQPHNKVDRIAGGPPDDNYAWTDTVMNLVGLRAQGLSAHYYNFGGGDYNHKTVATGFPEKDWYAIVHQANRLDEIIAGHSRVMDRYDHDKKVGLVVDEWGNWWTPEPGTNPGFLYQQNTIRDAVTCGLQLNILHAHHERVSMACIAQMVNVLQAMVLTNKEKMLLTPTYHTMEMYKVHQDATFLPVDLSAPTFEDKGAKGPLLSATASRDKAGKLHLSIVNLDAHHPAMVTARLTGATAKTVTGRVLTADTLDARNTFEHPDAVHPVPYEGATVSGDTLTLQLPAKSVTVLEIL